MRAAEKKRKPARPLEGRIALVAGATRGAGRGIACMLGEAGATVYCSGRSTREHPATGVYAGRPETIEDTAEMVTARGGRGIAVRVDHGVPSEVEALIERIRREQKRLDILVNDISEGVMHDFRPFWKVSLEKGFEALRQAVDTHLITSHYAAPLMIEKRRGLIVEITDGDFLGYHGTIFYDLVKITVNRLAWAMAGELRKHRVAAIAVTPGFMRTEVVLEHLGVTESNWMEGVRKNHHFAHSETPFFVGRAVAALAADPNVLEKSGGLFASWTLSDEYGFTDVDGRRPHWGRAFGHLYGNGMPASKEIRYEWVLLGSPFASQTVSPRSS
jgi:NAD(P)-dependent dehydrogenase (short-subunit alcohol dehydrogenase family)